MERNHSTSRKFFAWHQGTNGCMDKTNKPMYQDQHRLNWIKQSGQDLGRWNLDIPHRIDGSYISPWRSLKQSSGNRSNYLWNDLSIGTRLRENYFIGGVTVTSELDSTKINPRMAYRYTDGKGARTYLQDPRIQILTHL